MKRFTQRQNKLMRLVRKSDADAILVTNFVNVSYLTGFSGDDSYLLVTPERTVIVSDSRYTTQLEEECPDLELAIRSTSVSMEQMLTKLYKSMKFDRLAIESKSMTVATWKKLENVFSSVELVPTTGLVEKLRAIKDKDEIAETRKAIDIAQRAFKVVTASLRSEKMEKEVADEIENQVRLFGGRSTSFSPIVAVGPRAALPHAIPGTSRIKDSGFVLIDWGATTEAGYMSDLTRVVPTGKIPRKLLKMYEVTLAAQKAAIAAVKPGVKAVTIDTIARDLIRDAGFGKQFDHGLGHGLGRDIHEDFRLSVQSEDVLEVGMVFTVEPGIYFPGFGGVRIEDDVLVTRSGCEVLSSVPKEMDEVFN